MPTSGYLSQSLRRPLPTKDDGILRTVADAAGYVIALSKEAIQTQNISWSSMAVSREVLLRHHGRRWPKFRDGHLETTRRSPCTVPQ